MDHEEAAKGFKRGVMPANAHDWEESYRGTPPWDIGTPQPAFAALAEKGLVKGRVLDVGCGTGEHALMAAKLGLDATGVDIVAKAIETARKKAADRGLVARFEVGDALQLERLGQQFDTVLDCGLFHVLNEAQRVPYVRSLQSVTKPGSRLFILCFSDRMPTGIGPRRVSEAEIRATFADGWRVDAIEPSAIQATVAKDVPAWLATLTRM